MSGKKKGSPRTKKGAKSALPVSHKSKEREYAEWERIIESLEQRCLVSEDVDALKAKIQSTAGILSSLDRWEESPDNDYRGAPRDAKGTSTTEHAAWTSVANVAQLELGRLMNLVTEGLLHVIKQGHGRQAQYATRTLLSVLVDTMDEVIRLAGNERQRQLFREFARTRIEFPSLVSTFRKQNLDLEKFVKEDLELGAGLPFFIAPQRPYTTYTLLAMRIVGWIDTVRRTGWLKSEYRKVVKDLDTKDFSATHVTDWEKVIEFHLDYFQAPRKTQKKTAFEFGLEAEWQERDREYQSQTKEVRDSGGNLVSFSGPPGSASFWQFGEITKMREFRSLLESGRDKNVQSEADLYSRVKHRVIEAALKLMKA